MKNRAWVTIATLVALFVPCIATTPVQGQEHLNGSWQGYWTRAGDSMRVTLDVQHDTSTDRYAATSGKARYGGLMSGCINRSTRIAALILAGYTAPVVGQTPPAIHDSAGVQIVQNAATVRTLQPKLEARIGVVDGAPEYLLYSVYAVAVDAKGTHYVGMDTEVRVFDATGRYVRTMRALALHDRVGRSIKGGPFLPPHFTQVQHAEARRHDRVAARHNPRVLAD